MKSQVVAVRLRSHERVVDDPVLAVDEDDAPAVDRFVRRTRDLPVKNVENVENIAPVEISRRQAVDKASLRDRAFRLSAAVRRLIEAVDGDCVVRRG